MGRRKWISIRKEKFMERKWKLGVDLHPTAKSLDEVTFNNLILAVAQNQKITKETVQKVKEEILSIALQDFNFLIENNMAEIIKRAKAGDYS